MLPQKQRKEHIYHIQNYKKYLMRAFFIRREIQDFIFCLTYFVFMANSVNFA